MDSNTADLELAVLLAKADWDPSLHPRDPGGEGGGQFTRGVDLLPEHQPGSSADNPLKTKSVDDAARAIVAGKYVDLDQPRGLSTLTDKLAEIGRDAKDKGEKAPLYDLGKVTIRGTNLFMNGNLGVPRVEMPQFTGVPEPGSPADKFPRTPWGDVDLSEAYIAHLRDDLGVEVSNETIPAGMLRATQDELDGVKVASKMREIESGKLDPTERSIWTTSDDYIIDGHHSWAAAAGVDWTDEAADPVMIRSNVVHMKITDALRDAQEWTAKMGIKPRAVGKYHRILDALESMPPDIFAKFNEELHPRDSEGQFTDTGQGIDRSLEMAGQLAGQPTAPTDNVMWNRFATAEERLADARAYEGQHVLAEMRKGPSHTGDLHVTDDALVVDGTELDPLEVRGLVGYANWEKGKHLPGQHDQQTHGGGGNPLAEPATSAGPTGEVQASDADDAWKKLDADRFDRSAQKEAHPENYEPNRGFDVHLKLGATEWRRDVSEDGVPTIYQVRGTDSRTVPVEEWPRATLPMMAPDNDTPILAVRVDGSEQPDPFVYRVVSVGEFDQAQERGYFQSDQSMNLADEGTVTSRGSTGTFYAPPDGQDMRVVQLDMHPEDGWKVAPDGYVKTHEPVPFDRAHAYSTPLPNPRAPEKKLDLPDDPGELLGLLDNGLDTPEEVRAAIEKLGAIEVKFDAPDIDSVYLYQPTDDGEPTVIAWNGTDAFSETHNAYDWVGEQDASDYFPDDEQEWNDQFWRNPDVLYHGTEPDRIPEIMSEGLQMRSETRGMTNLYEGAAVYTSTELDEAEYYYDQVLVIDTAAMAEDGFKPFVNREPDVADAEHENALANILGLYDFEAEFEGGMSPSTVVVNGDIPPQYITVTELAKAIFDHLERKAAKHLPGQHDQRTHGGDGGLTRTDYEGRVGDRSHITAKEKGHIPTAAIRYLRGVMGERPGEHRNIRDGDWEKFKQDIATNGIKEPIFITVDHGEEPKISEGNHRRDAAVELGMETVPVEIRYFGHAEQEGTVSERYYGAKHLLGRHDQRTHGHDHAGSLSEIVADATPEGRYGTRKLGDALSTLLYEPIDEHGIVVNDGAEYLKSRNVVEIGDALAERAKTDPEVAAQLDQIGEQYIEMIPTYSHPTIGPEGTSYMQEHLHYTPGMSGIEVGAREVAAKLQDTWMQSASDATPMSWGVQLAAAERMGIDTSETEAVMKEHPSPGGDYAYVLGVGQEPTPPGEWEKNTSVQAHAIADSPAVKAYVDEVYTRTQKYLSDQGIDVITGYRGVHLPRKNRLPEGTEIVTLNPVSSFTTDEVTATNFSNHEAGFFDYHYVLTATVPADRVFSVAPTGPGCLNETEFLVLGGPRTPVDVEAK